MPSLSHINTGTRYLKAKFINLIVITHTKNFSQKHKHLDNSYRMFLYCAGWTFRQNYIRRILFLKIYTFHMHQLYQILKNAISKLNFRKQTSHQQCFFWEHTLQWSHSSMYLSHNDTQKKNMHV